MSKETVEINKSTLKNGAIIVLAVLLVVSMFTGGFGIGKGDNITAKAVDVPAKTQPGVDMEALMDDDAVKGDEDAPVTIVEFSDYECPFCARFYSQTYNQIKEDYIDTGKVKLVFRDFPLGFHKNAQKAAEAAECAGDQGMYYEMHDKLFENGVEGGVDSFKVYASTLGLDTEQFNECLDSDKYEKEVKQDMSDGQKAGVTGTPAFFINGEKVVGAQPYSVFQEKIEAALA